MKQILKELSEQEQRFATLKELIHKLTGLSLFDTQLRASRSLLQGKIAELPTGEGKTLAAVVAAICYVLDGHKVHILVFNDYLAKRDWSENHIIYEACELTVGFVNQHSTVEQRKLAYGCDVTYVSAKQAGFDYLKDFSAQSEDELVFPAFDVAIVDEADSIMIDECTTPLVLAGEIPHVTDIVKGIDECIQALSSDDYELSHVENKAWLTDKGLETVEKHLGLELYEEKNLHVLDSVQNALAAHYLLMRDKDYIVKDETIQLVEATTGRVTLNKRYPELLHRAVETKEGLTPSPLTMIYNSVTMQNFLRLYKVLCGMTGTAATSASEIESVYGLDVDVIPPHTPSMRVDHADVFFTNHDDFVKGIINQICDCYGKKQPVLIGTKTVAESEIFSELLNNISIPHYVLNAKNDEEEAAIIAQAGKPGRVTISTNMAGRGVDIRLGGYDRKLHAETVNAGGLFIISAGINPSKRIDNQLRGRAGRQGDVGESRFFVWLDDADLTNRMTPLEKVKAEIGSSKKRVNIVRKIQRQIEGELAEARYSLNRFSGIVEKQRLDLSKQRMQILKGEQYFAFLEKANLEKYQEILHIAGLDGIKRAEQQLALYFINRHWAEFLDSLENVRKGIHFISLKNDSVTSLIGGGKTAALDEYTHTVIKHSEQMLNSIKQDIIEKIETLPITKNGIDLHEAGLRGGTTTWTYAVDESLMQFSKIHAVVKNIKSKLSGENGILTRYYRKKRLRMGLGGCLVIIALLFGIITACTKDDVDEYEVMDNENNAPLIQNYEENYVHTVYEYLNEREDSEFAFAFDESSDLYIDILYEYDEYDEYDRYELDVSDKYEPPVEVIRPSLIGDFNVSPEGWRAVEDFLLSFPTLFMDSHIPVAGSGITACGWYYELEEGQFALNVRRVGGRWPYNWEAEITYEVPDIFFLGAHWSMPQTAENHGFFDRYRNRIYNEPWIWGDLYATSFGVWGFGTDGFPVISVDFGGNWYDLMGNGGGVPRRFFSFTDGEYRYAENSGTGMHRLTSSGRLYFDENGNLILSSSGMGGGEFVWFNHFGISENQVHSRYLAVFELSDWRHWYNYLTGEMGLPLDPAWQFTFFGSNAHILYSAMGITLTPVHSIGRI